MRVLTIATYSVMEMIETLHVVADFNFSMFFYTASQHPDQFNMARGIHSGSYLPMVPVDLAWILTLPTKWDVRPPLKGCYLAVSLGAPNSALGRLCELTVCDQVR
jgi:hypothetical protein